MKNKIQPQNKEELINIITKEVQLNGYKCNLNNIDVSQITNMSNLFSAKSYNIYKQLYSDEQLKKIKSPEIVQQIDWHLFNGNISTWDVSNVVDMNSMFNNSQFNGDISNWNTEKVLDMNEMFAESHFNNDISQWDTSKVERMKYMFSGSEFNGDISQWNVSNVNHMDGMFGFSKIKCDLSKWDIRNLITTTNMFLNSDIEFDISNWKPINLKLARDMFSESKFTIPYWHHEDAEEIKKRIIQKELKEKLEEYLHTNESIKKIKI